MADGYCSPDEMAGPDECITERDRLRAENTALAAALEDIAGMTLTSNASNNHEVWFATTECSNMGGRCCWEYLGQPDGGPEEWCPVCVAEICWCAWKMGVLAPPPPDPERSDAEVLTDLVALSDVGQVQIHMTHVDEGFPVYEVSWRKPEWSAPPHGPDIAAAGHSLGWPVAQVLEMAQPHIDPPPDPAVVVARWLAEPAETGNLEAAVRDLFPPEALAQAAAKVQEADR